MAEPDKGSPAKQAGGDEGKAELDRLGAALQAVQQRHREEAPKDPNLWKQRRSLGKGWSLAIEMVSAVAVSLFIGWWVDRWLGTAPWGLLGFILLGVAAAMWTAIRTGMAMNRAAQEDEQG